MHPRGQHDDDERLFQFNWIESIVLVPVPLFPRRKCTMKAKRAKRGAWEDYVAILKLKPGKTLWRYSGHQTFKKSPFFLPPPKKNSPPPLLSQIVPDLKFFAPADRRTRRL